MTDLPADAITAAAKAIEDHSIYADGKTLALAALEAAAPFIRQDWLLRMIMLLADDPACADRLRALTPGRP